MTRPPRGKRGQASLLLAPPPRSAGSSRLRGSRRPSARVVTAATGLVLVAGGALAFLRAETGAASRNLSGGATTVPSTVRTSAPLTPIETAAAMKPSAPVRIIIPSLKVNAPVTLLGPAAGGSIQVPPLANHNLAGWYDKYADQIDKLPILDVDQMLIGFAASTSQHLRAMSSSLNGISLESGYLQRQKKEGQIYNAPNYQGNYNAYGPYGGYYGGWGANAANNAALYRSGTAGGVTTVNNFEQIRSVQDALVTQGAAARVALWQVIDNETANVRRQLTQKFSSEF